MNIQFNINVNAFKKCVKHIKEHIFDDYNIEEYWFLLFLDNDNKAILVKEHKNKFWLFSEEEPLFELGKLSEHIFEFIENKEFESEECERLTKEHKEYTEFLNDNYGVGKI